MGWFFGSRKAREPALPRRCSPSRSVLTALMCLDEPHRTLLAYAYLGGLTAGEIAAREGRSREWVEARLPEGVERLERELARREEEPVSAPRATRIAG